MRSRFGLGVFIPVLLLLVAASVACGQQAADAPAAPPRPSEVPVEPARPLTATEVAAVESFVSEQEAINEEWAKLHRDFDEWRAGLTECQPSAAREALREFAGSFSEVTASATGLHRTASTRELADLVIAAADAEEAALRQLRDRWQAGNVSLLETVEVKRREAAGAQNAVVDMSLELQEEYEAGPTADEVEEMEEFSDTFDEVADAWDDFHDAYAAFAKRTHRMTAADQAAGYELLIEQLKTLIATTSGLASNETTEELIEDLLDAGEEELAALEYLAEFPPETATGKATPVPPAPRSTPAPTTESEPATTGLPDTSGSQAPPDGGTQQPQTPQGQEGTAVPPTPPVNAQGLPGQQTAQAPASVPVPGELELTPKDEFTAAVEEAKAVLADVEDAIEEIANDKSAEYLEDLQEFDAEFQQFVDEWLQFYEVFTAWRASDGGCEAIQVEQELNGFHLRAQDLSRQVRDLPQTGFLVPVYTLTVDAAELEAEAMRTLVNTWAPFAVDSFRAVDDERLNASRLRRQADIALAELQDR